MQAATRRGGYVRLCRVSAGGTGVRVVRGSPRVVADRLNSAAHHSAQAIATTGNVATRCTAVPSSPGASLAEICRHRPNRRGAGWGEPGRRGSNRRTNEGGIAKNFRRGAKTGCAVNFLRGKLRKKICRNRACPTRLNEPAAGPGGAGSARRSWRCASRRPRPIMCAATVRLLLARRRLCPIRRGGLHRSCVRSGRRSSRPRRSAC